MALTELVHGVARANTPLIKEARRYGGKAQLGSASRRGHLIMRSRHWAELPAANLLIGASAIEQGYAVATMNLRHFQMIPGLSQRLPDGGHALALLQRAQEGTKSRLLRPHATGSGNYYPVRPAFVP